MKSKRVYLNFIILLIFSGCASFKGNKLPPIASMPQMSPDKKKYSVFLDVNFYTQSRDPHSSPIENIPGKIELLDIVELVTDEANLFSSFTLDKVKNRQTDYTIKMDMLNYGDFKAAGCLGMISGLTLTIIPAAVTDYYRLTAKVIDSNGKEIKTYILEDHITTVIQTFMLFVYPFKSPSRVSKEFMSNMVKTLYKEIIQDNILTNKTTLSSYLDIPLRTKQ
ncbi:MAG: hypothetical protein GXO84_07615 [Chlorobi bacterium]|nr:hypothetical protein [Chlorobiota bacterium]